MISRLPREIQLQIFSYLSLSEPANAPIQLFGLLTLSKEMYPVVRRALYSPMDLRGRWGLEKLRVYANAGEVVRSLCVARSNDSSVPLDDVLPLFPNLKALHIQVTGDWLVMPKLHELVSLVVSGNGQATVAIPFTLVPVQLQSLELNNICVLGWNFLLWLSNMPHLRSLSMNRVCLDGELDDTEIGERSVQAAQALKHLRQLKLGYEFAPASSQSRTLAVFFSSVLCTSQSLDHAQYWYQREFTSGKHFCLWNHAFAKNSKGVELRLQMVAIQVEARRRTSKPLYNGVGQYKAMEEALIAAATSRFGR